MRYPIEVHKLAGLNLDLRPSEMPIDVYTNGKNVRYTNSGMARTLGHSKIFATGMLHAPYFVFGIRQPLNYYWIYPGASAVGVVDVGGTHADITPTLGVTASFDENWTGGQINGVPYLSNPNQDPIYWDGVTTNPMQTLPGWPANTKAKVVRTYNNFLVALDITNTTTGTNYLNRVKWSSSAAAGSIPNSWDETDPTVDTGQIELGGAQGAVIDCLPLYGDNIIYKDNSTYVMSFVGGQSIFSFRELFRETGIIGRNCAVQFRGKHCVLTRDDVIVHDGQLQQSIVNLRMRKWLFNHIDNNEASKSFLVPYHKKNEIWICFPTGGAGANGLPNMALIWNYQDNQFGVRELQDSPFINAGIISQFNGVADWNSDTQSWDADTSIWDQSLIGSVAQDLVMCSGSNLYQMDVGDQFDTSNFESYVERIGMPLSQNFSETKLLRALWPTIDAPTGTILNIRVGHQLHTDDPITWNPDIQYTIGTDDRLNSFTKGRLLAFRIGSSSGMQWTLYGIGMETKSGGRW